LIDRKPGPRVLVLVPTRELATQVDQTFKDCAQFAGFKVAPILASEADQ
jgi:superfamily II DNA/RNA helicase